MLKLEEYKKTKKQIEKMWKDRSNKIQKETQRCIICDTLIWFGGIGSFERTTCEKYNCRIAKGVKNITK